jgi:tetratricopeptide (TPR) repeat protein
MISNLNLLGQIHAHLLDQYEASMQYLDEALIIATTMGNVRAQAALLSNLGETVERQGDFEQARRLYQQALTLAVETGNKDKQVVYQANLGRIQALLGYYDEAVARLMDVITALPPQAYLLAEVNLSLAEAYLGQGQLDLALATSKDGLAQAQSNHKQLELGRAWMVLGRIAFQLKAPVYMDQNQQVGYDAPACFEKALEIFDDMRVKRERALAMSHWGQYELSAGHQEKGEQMIQEAVALLAAVHLTAR